MKRFGEVDLHPDTVPNPMMGANFEELIRTFNEGLDENPGEHFTPSDVVHLMVDLMLAGEEERVSEEYAIFTVHEPYCGTGACSPERADLDVGGYREADRPKPHVRSRRFYDWKDGYKWV